MESEKTLEQELAERIRAAVEEVRPETSPSPSQGPLTTSDARDAARRAETYLTPLVPEGARFARHKRALLRFFRFLWRDQAAFNALSLEAVRSLLEETERASRRLETAVEGLRSAAERSFAESRRRAAVQDARLAELEASPARSALAATPGAASPAAPADLPAGVYGLFEERFRGDPETIAQSQRFYLALVRDAPGPVLDVGCGRGEFLRLLALEGIEASGIEANPIWARLCREGGLAVEEGDARTLLAAREKGSLGAVVAFQVVEHWSAAQTFDFLSSARRALRPGGVLVAETINTDSLSALRAFFLDPTHVRPVPPAALAFLAEAAGFAETRIEYRSPLPAAERLVEATENDRKLNRLLFGPQDYALIARVPRAIEG